MEHITELTGLQLRDIVLWGAAIWAAYLLVTVDLEDHSDE